MRDFFRGWRRKAGCVTLIVTFAFMSMWVRSFSDRCQAVKITPNHMLSSNGGFVFLHVFYDGDWEKDLPQFGQFVGLKIKWRLGWERYGIIAADQAVWAQYSLEFGLTYWYFVIPLTLLSAYLLLIKPKPKPAPPAP